MSDLAKANAVRIQASFREVKNPGGAEFGEMSESMLSAQALKGFYCGSGGTAGPSLMKLHLQLPEQR